MSMRILPYPFPLEPIKMPLAPTPRIPQVFTWPSVREAGGTLARWSWRLAPPIMALALLGIVSYCIFTKVGSVLREKKMTKDLEEAREFNREVSKGKDETTSLPSEFKKD